MTITTLATALAFPESPRSVDGEQWFVAGDEIWRVQGEEVSPFAKLPGQLLSIQFHEGVLYAAAAHLRQIYRVDDSGVHLHADLRGRDENPINEFVVLQDGSLLVGQMGYDPRLGHVPREAPLLHVAPDGAVTDTSLRLTFANGMVLAGDGSTLIIAESARRRLVAAGVDADGQLGPARTFAELAAAPDGIALECDGSVWYAAHGSLVRIADGGAELERVELPYPFATSVALDDSGADRLFFTALAAVPHGNDDLAEQGVFGCVDIAHRPAVGELWYQSAAYQDC